MRIVVTGPESSGTRMLTRMLREAGGSVVHRPMPYGGKRKAKDANGRSVRIPGTAVWPELVDDEPDVVVVVERDLRSTIRSQVEVGHVADEDEALAAIRRAYLDIATQLAALKVPFWPVAYGAMSRPEARADLCGWLGLDAGKITTVWCNANAKYYGGPAWSDRRSLGS